MRAISTALLMMLVACNPDPPVYEDGETLPNGQIAGSGLFGTGVQPGSGTQVQAAFIDVGPSDDFEPIAGGHIAIGDKSLNQIRVLAIPGGVVKSIGLSATPLDLAYDEANHLLYVTLASSTNIARVNLSTDQVTYFPLPRVASTIAIGNGGRVFVAMYGDWPYEGPIAVIDGPGGSIVHTQDLDVPNLIAFDRVGNRLIAADGGLSPSSLLRYSYNPATDLFTFEEELWSAGSNGQDVTVSPDGLHIAFACGGGNGAGYTITDFSTADLTISFGSWDTGPYPRSARFAPDSTRVVATNGYTLMLFDVATHARVLDIVTPFDGLSYTNLDRVGYSLDGSKIFAYTDSGFDEDGGRLYYYGVP